MSSNPTIDNIIDVLTRLEQEYKNKGNTVGRTDDYKTYTKDVESGLGILKELIETHKEDSEIHRIIMEYDFSTDQRMNREATPGVYAALHHYRDKVMDAIIEENSNITPKQLCYENFQL